MASRIRRTVAKHKSPPAMSVPERSWVTQPARRAVPHSGSVASGSSPLFAHKSTSRGVFGDDVKYSGYAVQRDKQVSSCYQSTTPFV